MKFLSLPSLKKVGSFRLFKVQKNVNKKKLPSLSFNVDEKNNSNNFENECNVLPRKALHLCV
jgi:hypothetical protein